MKKRSIKDFKLFEADLEKNRALSKEYLKDIEKRGKEERDEMLRQGASSSPMETSRLAMELIQLQGGRIIPPRRMGEKPTIKWQDKEKKSKIENMSKDIFLEHYGKLVEALNLKLDFQLIDGDDIEKASEEMKMEPSGTERIVDDNVIVEIEKRKLVNNITQGTAKNAFRLIHLYKNKIESIDPEIFKISDRLVKSMEAFEWDPNNPLIDKNVKGSPELVKQTMIGSAEVESESDDSEKEEELKTTDFDVEKAIEGDKEELDKVDDFDFSDHTLKARAVDFTVLLHEAVKALYEFLGKWAIPEDKEISKMVIDNTDTLEDEIEDLRYGTYIKRDLLEFVTENDKIQQIDNGFEYVWGMMLEVPAKEFLELFKSMILEDYKNKSLKVVSRGVLYKGTSRQIIDQMIDDIIEDFEEYRKSMEEYEEEQQEEDTSQEEKSEEEPEEKKLSDLSVKELQKLMDDALDSGNMDEVERIGNELSNR